MNQGCLLVQPDSSGIMIWVILYIKGYWKIASGANPLTGQQRLIKKAQEFRENWVPFTMKLPQASTGPLAAAAGQGLQKTKTFGASPHRRTAPHRFDKEQD